MLKRKKEGDKEQEKLALAMLAFHKERAEYKRRVVNVLGTNSEYKQGWVCSKKKEKKTRCHCSINFSPDTLITAKTKALKDEIKLHEVQSRKKRKNLQVNLAKHYHAFHGWTKRQVTPFLLSSPTKKKKKKVFNNLPGNLVTFFFCCQQSMFKKKTLQTFHCFL